MKNGLKMRGVIVVDLEGSFNDIADINQELENFAKHLVQDSTVVSSIAGVKTRKGEQLVEDLDSVVFRHGASQ